MVHALLMAAVLAVQSPPISPDLVRAQLSKSGATNTVQSLDAAGTWDQVVDGIASGDTGWINLVPLLAPGADAGTAEDLTIALASALPKAPLAVLTVVGGHSGDPLDVAQVCSAPFIEDTSAHQHSYKVQALRAVVGVRSPALLAAAEACKRRLEDIR